MVQRNMSVKDITRSERHYLNGAYEDNGNGSDDEEQFMVQVELNNTRKRTRSKVCICISFELKSGVSNVNEKSLSISCCEGLTWSWMTNQVTYFVPQLFS